LGGGQLGLGGISTAVGMITLSAMEWIDVRIRREHSGVLVVTTEPGSPMPDLDELLQPLGYRARLRQQNRALSLRNVEEIETRFDLSWRQVETVQSSLNFLAVVERVCRVKSFEVVSTGEH
jgi:hypothetical protein